MTEPVSICSPEFKESLSRFYVVLDKSNHRRPQSQVQKELGGGGGGENVFCKGGSN